VIANGEIWTVQDALDCRRISGCEDLMLGRGMVSDPGLARAIRRAEGEGGSLAGLEPTAWREVVPALEQLWSSGAEVVSVSARAGRLKQWLLLLRRVFPEAATLFGRIRAETESEAITRAIQGSAAPQT
jgi:tRNA-dihydrouridine synthase C